MRNLLKFHFILGSMDIRNQDILQIGKISIGLWEQLADIGHRNGWIRPFWKRKFWNQSPIWGLNPQKNFSAWWSISGIFIRCSLYLIEALFSVVRLNVLKKNIQIVFNELRSRMGKSWSKWDPCPNGKNTRTHKAEQINQQCNLQALVYLFADSRIFWACSGELTITGGP